MRERPAHGRQRLVGIHPIPHAPRHNARPVLEVGRENTRDGFAPLLLTRCIRRAVALACAVKSGEVEPRPGNQGGQPGDEVQRLQPLVGRAVSERLFVLVHNPTPTSP